MPPSLQAAMTNGTARTNIAQSLFRSTVAGRELGDPSIQLAYTDQPMDQPMDLRYGSSQGDTGGLNLITPNKLNKPMKLIKITPTPPQPTPRVPPKAHGLTHKGLPLRHTPVPIPLAPLKPQPQRQGGTQLGAQVPHLAPTTTPRLPSRQTLSLSLREAALREAYAQGMRHIRDDREGPQSPGGLTPLLPKQGGQTPARRPASPLDSLYPVDEMSFQRRPHSQSTPIPHAGVGAQLVRMMASPRGTPVVPPVEVGLPETEGLAPRGGEPPVRGRLTLSHCSTSSIPSVLTAMATSHWTHRPLPSSLSWYSLAPCQHPSSRSTRSASSRTSSKNLTSLTRRMRS